MAPFKVDDLVYIPYPEHKEQAFQAGIIKEIDTRDVSVQLEDGEVRTIGFEELRKRFLRGNGPTSQDNTALVHMNDATIMENLKERHSTNEIYTYTASVLLAMNPYCDIQGLYGPEQCALYKGKHLGTLPPHPYAIADKAYRALVRDQKNQGFIISGESGAGKTETAKIVMQYLGFASGGTSDLASRIQARVLQAQPIMESFGNSVTMRNNNSSRFGKYNRVFFDDKGTLMDANVTTYLLETSRVVHHSSRERTYHCFYEMLRGMPAEKLQELGLQCDGRYKLLAASDSWDAKEEAEWMKQFQGRDVKNFQRLCEALSTVGFTQENIDDCFRVLAGVIHLGDLVDAEREDAASDESSIELNNESLAKAAELLGMDTDALGHCLKFRKVLAVDAPRTTLQFRHALHSLIKALYKRVFEHTVQRINTSFEELRPDGSPVEDGDEKWRHIGILDIYGFERLKTNSFEQLCINLANERLQQYFIENVLVAEQDLYRREGLEWTDLELPDATPVFNTIAQVFTTLDEFSQQQAKGLATGTDDRFCTATVDKASKDPMQKEVLSKIKQNFKRQAAGGLGEKDGFIIKHYAGPVEYNSKGWLDKNNDRLLQECENLIGGSKLQFVKSLHQDDQGEKRGQASLFKSISKKYSADLANLLSTLNTCHLHYIRCFKPNEFQKPTIFNQKLVLDQIVQCGTIELVKIMHDGYPNRCLFDDMVNRFRSLLPESFQRYGQRTFIEALMLAYDVPKEEWALGTSRLFLKAGQLKALEDMRTEGAAPDPDKLRLIVSGIIRKRWVRAKNAVQLCNYLPHFLSQIHAKKAAVALTRHSVFVSRLFPKLQASRDRLKQRRLIARRRILALVRVVCWVRAKAAQVRDKRLQRMTSALFLASRIHSRTRTWVAGARERASEATKRIEAERRREEERQAEQRRKLAEEKQQMEEQHLKMEEEMKQREAEAEEKRLQEEMQREEDDKAKAADREAAFEAKEKAWAEERAQLEEENKKLKDAHRNSIVREVPSPQRERRTAVKDEDFDGKTQASTVPGDEESEVGDSASAIRQSAAEIAMQKQMDERIKALEEEMKRKERETQERMQELQSANQKLEWEVSERRKSQVGSPVPSASPALSPLHMEQTPPPEGLAPGTPPSDARRNQKNMRFSLVQRDPRMSLMSSRGGDGPTGNRRPSVAHQALAAHEAAPSPDGNATSQAPQAATQRRWWAEQRQFLLEDLFPESPGSTPGRSNRRSSIGGGAAYAIDAERSRRASQPMQRLASHPEPEAEHEDQTIPQANLHKRFEYAHEAEGGAQHSRQQQAAGSRLSTDSRMRQPKLYWNDRQTGGR